MDKEGFSQFQRVCQALGQCFENVVTHDARKSKGDVKDGNLTLYMRPGGCSGHSGYSGYPGY